MVAFNNAGGLDVSPPSGVGPTLEALRARDRYLEYVLSLRPAIHFRLTASPVQDVAGPRMILDEHGGVAFNAPGLVVPTGSSAFFDGVDDFIGNLVDDVRFNFGDEMTMMGWIKTTNVAPGLDGVLLAKSDDQLFDNTSYLIQQGAGRNDMSGFFMTSNNALHALDTGRDITDGHPHLVGFTFKRNDRVRGYTDNFVSDTVPATNFALKVSTIPFSIGAWNPASPSRFWVQRAQDITLFPRAITAEEFARAYSLGRRG